MRRGAKPKKTRAAAKRADAGKSRKDVASRVRDLERLLAEALEREAEALKREADAQEQQTASAEILQVISGSPTDVQLVFDMIAARATTLCDGLFGGVFLRQGDEVDLVAHHNFTAEGLAAFSRLFPVPVDADAAATRAIRECRPLHIVDAQTGSDVPVAAQNTARALRYRSLVMVPMLHEGRSLGAIGVSRREVQPFSEREIALLQTFANQAVVAIENARLLTEVDARNRELSEALEQQTATSAILRVISESPTEVQPVFDAIAESSLRLLRGWSAIVIRFDGERLDAVAVRGGLPGSAEAAREAIAQAPRAHGTHVWDAILDREVKQIADVEAEDVADVVRSAARARGWRANLAVPMLRSSEPIGLITVSRAEAGTFSRQEVELLETFADQAVIAIENVRLFTELQEKNVALTETLKQQAATAGVLQAISSSTMDARPVFQTIVESAVRLSGALFGSVYRFDGELIHMVAHHDYPATALEFSRRFFPAPPSRQTFTGRAIVTRAMVHVPDVLQDQERLLARDLAESVGFRSALSVPMLYEGDPVGAITVWRADVGPFSDKHIELLQTFAAQAVIAIQNERLFQELQDRTAALTRSVEQLTALGEVGRAVSSTLDLETVLTTIVARAVELTAVDGGVVFEYDDGTEEFVHRAATENGGPLAETRRTTRIRKGEGAVGRTAITLEPVQVTDITVPAAYESRLRENLVESGIRAILAVPMVREGRLIGCLGVTRNRPGEFPAETIELLRTFATQSALAIQNARLFHEIEVKSRQLEAASRHKSEFLANMSHELRTPLNAIIGFSEVLTERMFGELNEKQDEYLKDIYASGQHLLSLINDILDLSKIEAGRMELELKDFDLSQAIGNAVILVRERAGRRGIALHQTVDQRLGQIRGDERKIKQVLLNLLSNALKFTSEGGRVDVRATVADGMAEVSVTDTGVGIAPEDQEAVFEEFRQVGPADTKVEGTGLGLTLSRKFVELHGGQIWVESEVGRGSTFTFTLPLMMDHQRQTSG